MLLEARNPANIRKWIARFYYFRHLYPSARVYCSTIIARVAHRYGATLSALLINILLGSFQLFLHSDQPLSEGDNPVQRCLPVGGGFHYPRRRRWWLHALIDSNRFAATGRRPAATSSRDIIFSFTSPANLHFASSAAAITLTHLHVSNHAFASFSSLAFRRAGFVGNGVITVMINSP